MLSRRWLAVGLALLGLSPSLRAEDGKDALGDPLPKGAKARLGTERMRMPVGSPLLMPDGQSILAIQGGELRRIDVKTGLAVGKPRSIKQGIGPSAVSADGLRLAYCRFDGVSVEELESGKKLCELKIRLDGFNPPLSFSADGKVLAFGGPADNRNKGATATVWNVDDDKAIATCKVVQNGSVRVALSRNAKVLATWSGVGEFLRPGTAYDPAADPTRHVQFWNAATGEALATAKFGAAPMSVALSPDGTLAVVTDGHSSIRLFHTKTGEPKRRLIGRSFLGKIVRFSDDGKAVAAGAIDGATQIWDVDSGRSLGMTGCPFTQEIVSLSALSFPTADRLVAFGMRRSAGVVWEAPSGKRLSPDGGATRPLGSVGFVAGDKEVIGAAAGGPILRWDLTGKELGALKLQIPGATPFWFPSEEPVLLAPGGKLMYRSDGSGIGLYELPGAVQRCCLPTEGLSSGIRLYFSQDGGKAATISPPPSGQKTKHGTVRVYEIGKDQQKGEFALPDGAIVAATLNRDGTKLAVLRSESPNASKLLFNAFDAETGKTLCESTLDGSFARLGPAPDAGRVLLTHPKEGLVEIDLAEGKIGRTVAAKAPAGSPIPPLLSDDGKLLAIADGSLGITEPSTIEVLDYGSGRSLHKFTGHGGPVTALAFSKDGKKLASGSGDTTILVWDVGE